MHLHFVRFYIRKKNCSTPAAGFPVNLWMTRQWQWQAGNVTGNLWDKHYITTSPTQSLLSLSDFPCDCILLQAVNHFTASRLLSPDILKFCVTLISMNLDKVSKSSRIQPGFPALWCSYVAQHLVEKMTQKTIQFSRFLPQKQLQPPFVGPWRKLDGLEKARTQSEWITK